MLIIDDSQPIHSLIRARLANEPIELISANSGNAGLELIRTSPPDLVLLDVEMPHPNGFEVCARLKSDPATMHIPVIFLTGSASTEQKIIGLNLGAVDYVTKPFDPAELRARVYAGLRLKFLLDLLSRKAQIDGLTGLWNRAYFDTRLSEMTSLARRAGHPLACVMVDVDHFKKVNDEHGHPTGDEVLRRVAQTLNELVREEDVICRYGGEEFVLLLPNTTVHGASELSERIRIKLCETSISRGKAVIQITASLGVAGFDLTSPDSLVQRADAALYEAKRSGRNRVITDQRPAVAAQAA